MPVMLMFPAACIALACGPVDTNAESRALLMIPAPPEAVAGKTRLVEPKPAKPLSFDGAYDFMKTSRRLRIWREAVQFDMTVDANGEATDCEVVDRFRKTYINTKLCELVMEHYTFEPARNEKDEAVEGSYRARISYAQLREELD